MENVFEAQGRNFAFNSYASLMPMTPVIGNIQSRKMKNYEDEAWVKLLYKYLQKKNKRQAIRWSYTKNYINRDEIKLKEMKEHSKKIMNSILGASSTPHSNTLNEKVIYLTKNRMQSSNNYLANSLSKDGVNYSKSTILSPLKRSVQSINSENWPQFKKLKIGDRIVIKKITNMRNIKNINNEPTTETQESWNSSPDMKKVIEMIPKPPRRNVGSFNSPNKWAVYSFQKSYSSGYCESISEVIKRRRAEQEGYHNMFSKSLKV